jgi:uncharacterized membrane protein
VIGEHDLRYRQGIAALALCGLILAVYLTLYHYGYVGALACGTGGCEVVQASSYSRLLGYPVALWGAGYYASVLVVATAGALGATADRLWPSKLLLALNGWSVLFSGYLTWAEVARIHQICRYCVASALIVLALFALSVIDYRKRKAAPSA